MRRLFAVSLYMLAVPCLAFRQSPPTTAAVEQGSSNVFLVPFYFERRLPEKIAIISVRDSRPSRVPDQNLEKDFARNLRYLLLGERGYKGVALKDSLKKLQTGGLTQTQLAIPPTLESCRILEVDAVLRAKIYGQKDKDTTIEISLEECKTGELLWKFDGTVPPTFYKVADVPYARPATMKVFDTLSRRKPGWGGPLRTASPPEGPYFAKPLEMPPGRAVVYLYRRRVGNPIHFAIRVNQKPVVELTDGGYYPYVAEPGRIELSAKAKLRWGITGLIDRALATEGGFGITAEEAKVYYVRGTWDGNYQRQGFEWTVVEPDQGLAEIQECRLQEEPSDAGGTDAKRHWPDMTSGGAVGQ